MESLFIISFILFEIIGTISPRGHRQKFAIIQHPDISQKFSPKEISTGETFFKQGLGKKLCRRVFRSDIYKVVSQNESLNAARSEFPTRLVGMVNNVNVQTLTYNREGKDVQIEVIKCAEFNGNALYIENASDGTNFYVFKKILNSNYTPLIQLAIKTPGIHWNILDIAEQAERKGVHLLPKFKYDTLYYSEEDFQSNYTAIGPRLWKNICSIKGLERFKLCSIVHTLVNPLADTSRNMVNQMREEVGTCVSTFTKLHIPSIDTVGRSGFLPVQVIGCYINIEIEEGVTPTFYIAPDHREDGGAFLLIKTLLPYFNHLIVVMRLTDILIW